MFTMITYVACDEPTLFTVIPQLALRHEKQLKSHKLPRTSAICYRRRHTVWFFSESFMAINEGRRSPFRLSPRKMYEGKRVC